MTVRILKCREYPELIGDKAIIKNTIDNQYIVDISPSYQRGNVVVKSLRFSPCEVEFMEY